MTLQQKSGGMVIKQQTKQKDIQLNALWKVKEVQWKEISLVQSLLDLVEGDLSTNPTHSTQ